MDARLLWASDILHKAPCLLPSYERVHDDEEQQQLLKQLASQLTNVTGYLRPSAQLALRLALEVAFLAHHGQSRRSGEPFVTHPVEVATILALTQMDKESVISGLLHDTVEDTALSFEEIESLFGNTVRKIVEGETKVSKLPKMVRAQIDLQDVRLREAGPQDEQVENLRSMFIAMAEDWRIVVVKLADRLHNMRTLQYMPIEKRAAIARETLEIFAPLAHRLGMWQYKTELSDLSFKYLFPKEYSELCRHIESNAQQYESTIEVAQDKLQKMLHADNWLQGRMRSVSVTGRTKSIYSTWKKMQRHECGIEKINDLVALRVVLLRESDGTTTHANANDDCTMEDTAMCYHVLGKVHGCWSPLPRTLKDYISSPKPNGYRSLHTTVLVGTQPLEIQIRTLDMHNVAEYGAAAHWAYKDTASLPWLGIIRQWQAQVDCAHDFVQLVREELLGTRVFIFTRNGRILNLARGASVADAALLLHATMHSHTVLVNGAPAAPSAVLQNGDIVSLERREPIAARDWSSNSKDSLQERAQQYLARRKSQQLKTEHQWERCPLCLPLRGETLLGARSDAAQVPGTLHRADCECRALQRQLAVEGRSLIQGAHAQEMLSLALEQHDLGLLAQIVVFCKDRRGILLDVSSVVTAEACNIMDVHSETLTPGKEAAFQYTVHVQDAQQLRKLVEAVRHVTGVVRVLRDNLEELMRESPAGFWANCHPLPDDADLGE